MNKKTMIALIVSVAVAGAIFTVSSANPQVWEIFLFSGVSKQNKAKQIIPNQNKQK